MPVQTMSPTHWRSYWLRLVDQYADRLALEADDLERPLCYAEVLARAEQIASGLATRGVGPGARVLTRLNNDSSAMLVHIALLLQAACEVPLSADTSDAELLRLMTEADAGWVIASRVSGSELRAALGPQRICEPSELDTVLHDSQATRLDLGTHDIAMLPGRALPSSGTTGLPRLSVYSHAARWRAHRLQCRLLPYRPAPGEALLLATPFSHGASLLALAWWHAGGRVVLLSSADVQRMHRRAAEGPCALFAPPTVLRKLLDAAPQTPLPIKLIFTGTQQLDAITYQRARAMYGPVVRVTYGKSECINPICLLQPAETDEAYSMAATSGHACVGFPAPGVEIQIRADEGKPLPAGQAGHVFLRARHMSSGQWQNGQLIPWPDGWHDSSDRGYLDETGRLWLLGRRGDVIKSGGYLVALEAVDAILRQLEPECDCTALAIPSTYWGAVVVAVVAGGADRMRNRLNEGFAGQPRAMRPRLVLSVESLPRNAQGKLMRPRLLDSVLATHVLVDGPYPRLEPQT